MLPIPARSDKGTRCGWIALRARTHTHTAQSILTGSPYHLVTEGGQIGVTIPKMSSSLVVASLPVMVVKASTKASAPVWL